MSFQIGYTHSGVSNKRRYSATYSWHCGHVRLLVVNGVLHLESPVTFPAWVGLLEFVTLFKFNKSRFITKKKCRGQE